MASNIQEEDEPMHPAGLDMTRESLQDILDGEDVNVSTALPTVAHWIQQIHSSIPTKH